CRECGKVKREKIDWLAKNPFYTKRFSYFVGRKCRSMTIQDVAKELRLDWHAVKNLEKEYMEEQLRRNPVRAAKVIGIDEISKKRATCTG
ncbi:MAG: helix-turn-helix domain-containing protein, partial [Elusimicrobiota bacterium]